MNTTPAIRGAAPVPPANWLDFSTDVLCCIGDAKKPAKGKEREAAFWDKQVPGSRGVVDLILAYARNGGQLNFEVNDVACGWVKLGANPPLVISDGMEVFIDYKLFDAAPSSKRSFLPFKDRRQNALAHGQWVDLNVARVRLGSLIPAISMEGEAAVLSWSDPPAVELGTAGLFGLLRRVTRTQLSAIRISREYGEFVTTGLAGWALPRLVWG